MKKTYISPLAKTVKIRLNHVIADSLRIGAKEETAKTSGTSGGWARQDNAWDIWGSDDAEE